MKTIFDEKNRLELIDRIKTINANSRSQWGKMNIYQMLKHCTFWDEWIQGKNKQTYKRELLGLIFGRMALKGVVSDDKPLRRNTPTSAPFKIKELSGDIELEKKKWISLIEGYENYSNPNFVHDFFGKMTKEQIGILAYKHSDHHLRQFNA